MTTKRSDTPTSQTVAAVDALDSCIFKSCIFCLMICSSCSGASQPAVDESAAQSAHDDDVNWEAIAYDCLELLASYRVVDMSTASEAELDRQMREALLNVEVCEYALATSYRGPGGRVMGDHLARSLAIHASQAELTLSSRFDSMRGYCDILEEIIRALDNDLTQIYTALRGSITDEDLTMLTSLWELTHQSLQISLLDHSAFCR